MQEAVVNICFVQSLCFESVRAPANQALFAYHALPGFMLRTLSH